MCVCPCSVTSGVDRKPLEGVHSVRMQQDTEFESDGRTIRCTEVGNTQFMRYATFIVRLHGHSFGVNNVLQ